jgi:DUF4097 and DUF4098 domain-containing protein YvlB
MGEVPVAVAQCSSATISYKAGELKYGFDVAADSKPSDFYFNQRWTRKPKSGSNQRFIQTAGRVIVQAAPVGASVPVSVVLDVMISHAKLADAINIKNETGGLIFESDAYVEDINDIRPCISIIATISVTPSANVSAFSLNTTVLPIMFRDSLNLTSNNIFAHSISGHVTSDTPDLDSRKIEIETVSGTVSGSFPLADLLSLKTVSGSVIVDIEPKESGVEEHDSTLLIRTSSGKIHANTAVKDIPSRKFITNVKTVSGAVTGTFLLGAASTINTVSGSVKTDFYTAGDAPSRSLIVNSVSGSVHVTVNDDSYKLNNIRSNCQTRSGKVDLQFPSAWGGQIKAETISGSIKVVGDGVKIIKDSSPFPSLGRTVLAEKAGGESMIFIQTVNAAISVGIGS